MSVDIYFNLQLASTAFMCGVIWVVQLLVYPNFLFSSGDSFKQYHQHHTNKITWIVAPAMLVELFLALLLLFQNQNIFLTLNMFVLVLIWLQTAFVSVPMHNRLSQEFNVDVAAKLIKFNWQRTALWSLRLIALLAYDYWYL